MRRPLALLCTLVLLSTMLVAGSVVGSGVALAQSSGSDFPIRPQDPVARDIRNARRIIEDTADGAVVLPSSEPVASATFVGLQVDGTTVRRPLESVFVEPDPSDPVDFHIRNSSSGLDLLLNGPCIWGLPGLSNCEPHQQVVRGWLEVTLANGGGTYTSSSLAVDYLDPVLVGYNVTGSREITVVFSDVVRVINNAGFPVQDSPSDWRVEGNQVQSVRVGQDDCRNFGFPAGTSGCTRILTLTNTLGEDDTPMVNYAQQVGVIDDPTRMTYEDFARNVARTQSTRAIDRLRPAIPSIEDVIDRVPTTPTAAQSGCITPAGLPQVLVNDPTPTLTLGNISDTHSFAVEVDGTAIGDPRSVPDGSATVDVDLPPLADGGHVVEAIAIDPSGNRSDNPTAGPSSRRDGANNPLCVVVDTKAPLPGSAVRDANPRVIVVTFLEDIAPVEAGTWTVGTGPTAQSATTVARGNGNRELRITFPSSISAAIGQISWRGTDGDRYSDAAGNPMADFTLPLTKPALPLRPIFTAPSPVTPRYTNAAEYAVRGTLDPAQAAGEVSRIEVSADGVAPGDQPAAATPASDGTWQTPFSFPADGVYRFTARAANGFGDVSAAVTSDTVVSDRTAPVVTILSPAPPRGPLGLPGGTPEDRPAGEPIDVRLSVDEVNYDDVTVRISYTDPDPNDGVPAPDPSEVVSAIGNGAGEPFVVPIDTPAEFVGGATITVVAIDLATNTSDTVQTVVNLTDAITGPIRSDLVANRPGDTRIEMEFIRPLTGATFPTDWSADNGIEDGQGERSPVRVTVDGKVVTLTFSQPFPGLVAADRNASPLVSLVRSALTTLKADDGREVSVTERLTRDLDAPETPTVNPSQVGPARLDGPAPSGSTCATTPAPGCPFTATFSGRTHESQRPNLFTVRGVPAATAASAPGTIVAQGRANPDGTFTFTVPVSANATSAFRVDVQDPGGNAAPSGAVVTVIEDSRGPDLSRLFASLVDADTIRVNFATTPADGAAGVDLTYALQGGSAQPIAQGVPVAEDGTGSFTWNFPDTIDISTGALLITAIAKDGLGNAGQPATTGLGNLPEITGAAAGSLTSVAVSTSEPVTTAQEGNAGFTISGGPGVAETSIDEAGRIVLTLNGELPGGQMTVTYNGRGGWTAADGRPLKAGSAPFTLAVLQPVTGLVAGVACTDGVVLSFIDQLNEPSSISGYEISRDGQVIGTVPPGQRTFTDASAPDGASTYSVVTIAADGRRSEPATVTFTAGRTPVPAEAGTAALRGGTGAPAAASTVADPRYTAEPNVGPGGGTVVSCDGRVTLTVPPGAVAEPMYAAIGQLTGIPAQGFQAIADLYQVAAVTADGFATVDSLGEYAEVSVRGLAEVLDAGVPERVTLLRLGRDTTDELAARVGAETAATQVLTLGAFEAVQAEERTTRVFGPDPAITSDRFATAAGLSQTSFRRAGAAVLARADDYPDALASAPLAALVGGPVLLTRTDSVPDTTLLELRRLEVTAVTLVGGTAAISQSVEDALVSAGFTVRRIGGADRFETSALVAEQVGTVDGAAFLATGQGFADALAASAPAAALGRPILLTPGGSLSPAALRAAQGLGVSDLRVVGGEAAISEDVAEAARAAGFDVERSAGPTRYATSVAIAEDLGAEGLFPGTRAIVASGDGDGVTSPDALAAGPVAGRHRGPLLLVSRGTLPAEVAAYLEDADTIAGITIAGGPVAVDDEVRALIDATG